MNEKMKEEFSTFRTNIELSTENALKDCDQESELIKHSIDFTQQENVKKTGPIFTISSLLLCFFFFELTLSLESKN